MSGGSYEYVSYKIEEAAGQLRGYHPQAPHVIALADHLDALADVLHDIEWADSGDTSWDDALDAKIRAVLAPGAEFATAVERAQILYQYLGRALASRIAHPTRIPDPTLSDPVSE